MKALNDLHQEDILRFIVDSIGSDRAIFENYGYDFYATKAAEKYVTDIENIQDYMASQIRRNAITSAFFDAAWELCRRGIFRPGVRSWGEQATQDGSAGNGYCITPFGEHWLKSEDKNLYVPTEPERFAELLNAFQERFGLGFHQRSQEALRCYCANAYLASCAMSGAATESIILATASKKIGEEEAMKLYRAQNGRKRIIDALARTDNKIRENLENQLSLLNYWRDNTAHGTETKISSNEAFVALAMLLRVAQFVEDNWDKLTTDETSP